MSGGSDRVSRAGEPLRTVRPDLASPPPSALTTVRRLILFLLLFALVLIGASGLSGLLGRLFSSASSLAERDVGGLARSLAFALVGGTLAAILGWAVWRRLRESGERNSLAWGLYIAGVYAVALVTSVIALLGLVSSVIGGASPQWHAVAAVGLVWTAVWAWHRRAWLHPDKGPGRLAELPTVFGSVFGLIVGTGGALTALGSLFDVVLLEFTGARSVGEPWWVSVAQPLVWTAGGATVWWWHWGHGRGLRLGTGLAKVAVAIATASLVAAASGIGVMVNAALGLAETTLGQRYHRRHRDGVGKDRRRGCRGIG